jgi:hypothetical protein
LVKAALTRRTESAAPLWAALETASNGGDIVLRNFASRALARLRP